MVLPYWQGRILEWEYHTFQDTWLQKKGLVFNIQLLEWKKKKKKITQV